MNFCLECCNILVMNSDTDLLQSLMNFSNKEPIVFFSITNDLDYDHSHNLTNPILIIEGVKGSVINLSLKKDNLGLYSKFLKQTIFAKDKKVLCFNSKPFFSYLLSKNINPSIFECSFLDMQWFFSYSGKRDIQLSSINDVLKHFSEITTLLSSERINLYKSIYGLLLRDVIPCIENNCLIDIDEECKVFSFYKVEGQENGRLSCQTHLKKSFNPHSIGEYQRTYLRPCYPHDIFMLFDYKNMEVSVLAEICNDKNLNKILESKKDFYESIYKLVIGGENEKIKYIKNENNIITASQPLLVNEFSKTLDFMNSNSELFKDIASFIDNSSNILKLCIIKKLSPYYIALSPWIEKLKSKEEIYTISNSEIILEILSDEDKQLHKKYFYKEYV